MEITLTSFDYFNYGIMPLGLGYLNGSLKEEGLDSTIRIFEEEESRCYEELINLDFFGQNIPLNGVQRYQEQIELTANRLFGEVLGFVSPKEDSIISEYPNVARLVTKQCDRIAQNLSRSEFVGFTTKAPSLGAVFFIVRGIRECNPSSKIVLGGPMTDVIRWVLRSESVLYGGIRKALVSGGLYGAFEGFLRENVDYLVHGEGERTLVDIVKRHMRGGDVSRIAGTTVFSGDRIRFNRRRPLADIDSLPHPDFGGINPARYHSLSFHLSRGCVNKCIFCDQSDFWDRFRVRDPQDVADEIAENSEKFKIKYFCACDSLLNGDRGRLAQLCDAIIDSGVGINWGGNLRITQTDEKLLDKLKESGFERPKFGLESIDQDIIDEIKKSQDVGHSLKVLKYAKDIGMKVTSSIIMGYPGKGLEYELGAIGKFESKKTYFDDMPVQVLEIGLRSVLAKDPARWGFQLHHTPAFNKTEWDGYGLAHMYVPGILSYFKNGLSRGEIDHIFSEYSRRGLLTKGRFEFLLRAFNSKAMKPVRRIIPYELKSLVKSEYVKRQNYY